jgi:exopolyphosphatase/guanosine-5'-triphosphate,3'-diphosphate pyrophosphatase
MSEARRLAAIDIGTVTMRLLIADVSATRIDEVVRCTDITHLGEGTNESGRLSPEALARVAEVARRYAGILAEHGVSHVTAYATSASRDAENGADLVAVMAESGISAKIIDGESEARLSFAGATWSAEGEGILVVDVGGGSTELVFGSAERDSAGGLVTDIELMRSVDIGSRRITEMFLRADPPTHLELDAARTYVASELRTYFDAMRSKPRILFSLAGAATSLSAINMELDPYDSELVHLSCLTGPQLADLVGWLSGLTLAKRREVVGLHPDRAAVIVAGALIIESALALSGLDSTVVSEHDILYGILLEAFSAPLPAEM